jgi:hypothetical protein
MRLTSTGLGIGTSSPSFPSGTGVAIYNSTVPRLKFTNSTTGDASTDGTQLLVSGSDFYIQQREAASVFISTNGTNAVTVDASQNLGLGVTPSAWWSSTKALQFGAGGVLSGRTDTAARNYFASNAYLNSTPAWTYIATNYATRYEQNDGQHQWHTAPSGTAGNPISFTQAMTLDASGNLGLGSTSISAVGSYRVLEVNGTTGGYIALSTAGTRGASFFGTTSGVGIEALGASNFLQFYTNSSERLRIASTGAFGLSGANYGTSGQVLTSGGSAAAPTWTTVSAGSAAGSDTQIQYNNSTAFGAASSFTFNKSTTAPQLNLVGTTSSNLQLRATTATNGPYVGLSLGNADAAVYWTWDTIGAIPLRFVAAGVEQMRLNGTGQLGVNATPSTSGVNSGTVQIGKAGFADSSSVAYALAITGGSGNGSSGTQTGGIKIVVTPPNYITTYGIYVDQVLGGTGQTKYAGYFLSSSGSSNVSSYTIYANMDSATTDGLYATNYSVYSEATGTGQNSTVYAFYAKLANKLNTIGMLIDDGYSTSATKTAIQFIRNSSSVGTITTTLSATAYNTSSDYRLKENVQVIQNALDDVMRMRPVTYDWISNGDQGIGFIAHELQEVVPQAVYGTKDETKFVTKNDENDKMIVNPDGSPKLFEEPVYQGVDASFVVPHLVKAIQELKAEFDAYKAAHP